MRRELHLFLTAVMFYTRIPCPAWGDRHEEMLGRATKYFPLIGWIAGVVTGTVYWLSMYVFPVPVSVTLSMIAGILLTGGFHEDGFADFCDGFGGGWTREKILAIMKDSRVGSYGVLGIVLILLLKFSLLNIVEEKYIFYLLLAAHALSRFTSVLLIVSLPYAREGEEAKSNAVSGAVTGPDIVIAALAGLLPLALLPVYSLFAVLPVLLVTVVFRAYIKKWIGGYTGDCLGAVQQLNEVIFYLSFAGVNRWISGL